MSLVIRRKVSLDFLGDEYKESFIEFKAIPIKDFHSLQDEQEKIGEDSKKALSFIADNLKKYFIRGKAPNEAGELADLTQDDIYELDQESVIRCFEILTGQNVNEESDFLEPDSKKPSSTTPDPQSNS